LLLEYKAQHGSTVVPQRYDKNPQLGHWVGTQRRMHSKKQLSSNRVLRLESIGFVWCAQGLIEANWESMFQLLLEYKAQHGNTLVPRRYVKNPRLGIWVQVQRRSHRQKKLLSNRFLRLECIGFVWCTQRLNEANWELMFQSLLEYKAQHGHTLIPRKYDKNPRLGIWVQTQRKMHRNMHSNKKASSNRVLRLESIGFVFNVRYRN